MRFIREFIFEMIIDPIKEGTVGSVLIGLIMAIVLSFVLLMVFAGIYYAIDFPCLSEKEGICIVSEKWFVPEHTSVTYMHTGKILIPQYHHYYDSWYIKAVVENENDNVKISESYWAFLTKGDTINCTYSKGRISNALYIKSVYTHRPK